MSTIIGQIKSSPGRVRTVARHIPSRSLVGSIYETPNGIFSIAASDIALANALRRSAVWSDKEVGDIRSVTHAASRVLFVGAHVGTLVVPVARHVNQVVAIEANPDTYRFLAANVALNGLNNVVLHSFAADKVEGEIEFILSRRNSGGAKRKLVVADARYTYDNLAIARVPLRCLDDMLWGEFDVIVMDIEGSEFFALRGMSRLLSVVEHLFVQFLPHHLRNVVGVDADLFCDLILPHLPHLRIDSTHFNGAAARAELRRMFDADEGKDLIRFSRIG